MRNKLFIFLLLNVFLVANTPTSSDFTNARLMNGNGEGSSLRTEISVVIDINTTNVVQFNKVDATLTSINKTSHPYLIKKLSYNGNNPIRAKIASSKLFLVFNLHDTNATSPSGNLVIGDNIIRDGSTGGATNSGLSIITNIGDKATPILLSANTIDSDSDGHIDKLRLIFTESVSTNTNTNNGFSVSNYTVLGISSSVGVDSNDSPNSKDVYLRLKEKSSFDTDARPSVSYSQKLSNTLGDNDNNITTISSFLAQDKAKPILLSAYATSVHNGADIINLGFSEPVFNPLDISGNTENITTSGGTSLDGALVKYSNGDRNISMELNESKHQGYISSQSISVNIYGSAKDKNGNYFTKLEGKAITVVLETIKPKLVSLSRLGDKGYFVAGFNEAMEISDFNKDSVHIEYKGTLGGRATPYMATVSLSQDKKTATFEVLSVPVFTKAESRVMTFIMNDTVKDLAGNSIDINESNKSFTITKDDTSPQAKDFTIDINDKKIIIEFNESIAINTFNPTGIVISRYNEGNISLTTHSKATYDEKKVIITLNDDINALKSF